MHFRKRWQILAVIVVLAASRILHDSMLPTAPAAIESLAPTTEPADQPAADAITWRNEWLKWLLTPDNKPLDAPAKFASDDSSGSGTSNGDGDQSDVWLLGRSIQVMTIEGSQPDYSAEPNRAPIARHRNDRKQRECHSRPRQST